MSSLALTYPSREEQQRHVREEREKIRKARERAKKVREAWLLGRLKWKLKPEQRELYEGIVRPEIHLVYGDWTRRGGKSYSAVVYCIEQAIRFKQTIKFGTAFKTDLERFIIPTFNKIIEDCPEDLRPKWSPSKKIFTFKRGSIIELVGLDKNPDGLRGNDVSIIVIDEAGFVAKLEYIYRSVIIPATARQKKIKIIIISTPSRDGKLHFCYQLLQKAKIQNNGFYHKKTIDELSDIDEEEKERLFFEVGGRESENVKREFYCEWIVPPGLAICPTFDAERHVQAFAKLPEFANWIFSGDLGGVKDHYAGYSMAFDHDTGLIHVWNEVFLPPWTPSSVIVKRFKEIEEENVNRFIDTAGQTKVDFVAEHEYPITTPTKTEFHSTLTFLRNQIFQNRVLIHPQCKMLIQTLEGGLLTESRSDFQRSEVLGHCDAAMALVYGLRHIDTSTDNRPQLSKTNAIVFEDQSGFAKQLFNALA